MNHIPHLTSCTTISDCPPQNIIAQYLRIYAYCDHPQIPGNQIQTLVQSIIVAFSSIPPTGRSGVAEAPQDNQDHVDVTGNEDEKGHFRFILKRKQD